MVSHTIWYLQGVTRKSGWVEPRLVDVTIDFGGKNATASFEHPDLPGWGVDLEIDAIGQVASLTLRPWGGPGTNIRSIRDGTTVATFPANRPPGAVPDGGVTARLLRRVPVGALLDRARQELTDIHADAADFADQHPDTSAARAISDAALSFASRPGRRGRPDVQFAQLADAYVRALGTGRPSPVQMVAQALYISPDTARNALHEARRRGLLTRPPPGRAGGQLTDKARRLLEASHGEH